MTAKDKITIIGAGLAGPLLAIELLRRGFAVEIYERRPDMRRVKISAGRSINLALSTRGIHALKQAGLWDSMQRIIIQMRGRRMHAVSGDLTFQPYGKDDTEVINSISRAELNIALLNAAEERGVKIHFNQRCTGMDFRTGAVYLHDEGRGTSHSVDAGVVIGTDGSASAIRTEMLKLHRFDFSQRHLDYGYKELTIASGPTGEHMLDRNALHIWPRGTFMLIALPNIDGTFGCILFLPFEGKQSFESLDTRDQVIDFFRAQFPDAVPLMPHLGDNFFGNPTGSMVTIKCSPWHVDGKALLLGDSAHAIVPFFGQGLNCAFEDCTVLLELLDRLGPDWPAIFDIFGKSRKQNTDAIADLAVENFIEMRDRVADPHFLFRKKVELALEARFPGVFVPKYAMVTFNRIPYSIAAERGRTQDRVLDQLCNGVERIEDLDWAKAEQLVRQNLSTLEARS